MAKKSDLKQWSVPMRMVFDTTVTVEAASAEEAKDAAENAVFVDDGMNGASMVDWKVTGRVTCDE